MKQSLFLKKCSKFCYVLFAVCGCLACTQNQKIEWPQVTNETKPWTRWWWEGNAVRTTDLDTVMRKYQEANLGGLEITPIYGIHGYEDRFKDFLSPEWVDLFLYTLQEAKQLGLGIDLANASGCPGTGLVVTFGYDIQFQFGVQRLSKRGLHGYVQRITNGCRIFRSIL